MQTCDVAIVGAGPYGLSSAAFLKTIKGLQVKVFGEPLALWKHAMPKGMFLRSPLSASHICDPNGALSFDTFLAECGNHLPKPIPLDRFVAYGDWFQRKAVPEIDPRNVRMIEKSGDGFQVTTTDGEPFQARRVVIATGPGPFAWRPPEFDHVPAPLASHSTEHSDLSRFQGKRVFVLGCGQSALENAALLHEAGANVEVVMRKDGVHWLLWKSRVFKFLPMAHLLYSPRDVGPAGVSQLIARPDIFRQLPRGFQDWATKRSLNPAGAMWLKDRLANVPMRTSCLVEKTEPVGDQLRVRLSNGDEETIDHLMLSTGFRVNLARYAFLSPELLQSIEQVEGYPRLRTGLESSVGGLYFLGAPTGWSFGPLARFVSGTFYSPAALTKHIASQN